ncbi:TPA: SHOCT domain-containing protein [Candidatus Woesearchaeota archaeon]|nr:SHOCT domain-containing protein [Candidatus Woesearchaeota archaeon]HII64812.1 SHOCT domain-containing protein [Candidatus Woesearchaeota archaeon]
MARRIYCNENIYIGYGMMGSGGMMNMMGRGMMGNYPASYDYSNYGYWNIFWILLLAAVIFLVVWIIHRFGIKKTASETPLNISRKRFAKGEITKKEFEDMKKDLGE